MVGKRVEREEGREEKAHGKWGKDRRRIESVIIS